MLARMTSVVLVQRKGFGSALWAAMNVAMVLP
jgi:hypothetical protein